MRLFNAQIKDLEEGSVEEELSITESLSKSILVEVIDAIYLSKVQESSDRNAIKSAMRAAGLSDE